MILREFNSASVPLRDLNMAMEKINLLDTQQRKTNAYMAEINSSTYAPRVDKIVAGTNITVDPVVGTGTVTISSTGGGGGAVTKILGTNGIVIDPLTGIGDVTVKLPSTSSRYQYQVLQLTTSGKVPDWDWIRAH